MDRVAELEAENADLRSRLTATRAEVERLTQQRKPMLYTGEFIPKEGLPGDSGAMRLAWQFFQRRVGDGSECATCGEKEGEDHKQTDVCGIVGNLLHETRLALNGLTALRAEHARLVQELDSLHMALKGDEIVKSALTEAKERAEARFAAVRENHRVLAMEVLQSRDQLWRADNEVRGIVEAALNAEAQAPGEP